MAPRAKARFRHIAISVPDPCASAEFYKEAFGLAELSETAHSDLEIHRAKAMSPA